MKLIDINRNPTDWQLKQFALAALVFLPLLGWLASGKPHTLESANLVVLGIFTALGVVVCLVGFLRPQSLQPLFVGASLLTLPIGLVVGEAILLVVYYGLFTPLSLLFRLLGRDALQRKLDRGAATYWQPKQQPDSPKHYYRQF